MSLGTNSQGMFRLTSELEAKWGPVLFSLGLGYSMNDSVSTEHRDEADSLHYRRLGATVGITLRF